MKPVGPNIRIFVLSNRIFGVVISWDDCISSFTIVVVDDVDDVDDVVTDEDEDEVIPL